LFVEIGNTPRPYAWGSATAIAELLGREPSGAPEAELWLGTHPGSPSRVVGGAAEGGGAGGGPGMLGEVVGELPYLLKVLAASAPLSLQAHPDDRQAREGYERENAAGVPLDAPHRNYRDASAKPEMIYALSPAFEALCGFRPVAEVLGLVDALLELDAQTDEPQPQPLEHLRERLEAESLRDVFAWLASGGTGVATLVDRVTELALATAGGTGGGSEAGAGEADAPDADTADAGAAADRARALDTVRRLVADNPGDPGIAVSLLLNRVTLRRGEALYLPAGNIHAYLSGLGIELMSSSDNVLRGGLTPKHIDVPELLRVLDFTPGKVPLLVPAVEGGAEVFRTPAGLVLVHIRSAGAPGAELRQKPLSGPVLGAFDASQGGKARHGAIAICVDGRMRVSGRNSAVELRKGQACYITADEGELEIRGAGELFVATADDSVRA